MIDRIEVRNPRTEKIDYWITSPTRTELIDTCARLRQAQVDWHRDGLERRIEAVQQWKQAIVSHKAELVEALAVDTGRLSESMLEVKSLVSSIDRWCSLAPELLQSESKTTAVPFVRLEQQLVPYPLVGVISPWNFPLLLSAIDTIPALLAGCAVIIKPSEVTPRFIQPWLKTIALVPQLRDILTCVSGAGDTGAALVELVDLVCFTGSVATGRKVALAAARQFIPAFLELGGKDPAIVLASADIELATSAILWGATANAGQSCLSIERIYVEESIGNRFVELLVTKAKKLKFNYPSLDSGEIGPIIAREQADIISEHLQEAIERGGIVCCGGGIEQLDGGLWCQPTVLTQVNHDLKVMSEETFAPIMPVMFFSRPEKSISLANDSKYGLSAAVFAGSSEEALKIANCLQAGAVSINDAGLTAFIHEAEKNSFKFSGMGGSRMGAAALTRFMRKKAFLIKTNSLEDPWWYKT